MMGRVRPIGITVLLLSFPAAIVALLFSDPWTFTNIQGAFLVIVTAPFQSAWLQVRSTGPLRRAMLLLLFVALPVLLLPAYAARPKTGTGLLTVVGAVLWIVSGFLMLALREAD
jgi:hypothetical protein